MIESSLASYSTKVNFLIHNIAQYTSASASEQLLSFSDRSASIEADGKVASRASHCIAC